MCVMFLFRHVYESNNLSAAAIYYCAGLYLHVTLVVCIANTVVVYRVLACWKEKQSGNKSAICVAGG